MAAHLGWRSVLRGDHAEASPLGTARMFVIRKIAVLSAISLMLSASQVGARQALSTEALEAAMPISPVLAAGSRIPPARDGNIAIQEELEAARKAQSVRAYELFIERHSDHPLSEMARQELDRLRKSESGN